MKSAAATEKPGKLLYPLVTPLIYGHIHSAALRPVGDVVYVNCGDWVDSCTAIVEHHDGRLELVRAWQAVAATEALPAVPAAVSPAPARCVPVGTLDQLPQPASLAPNA